MKTISAEKFKEELANITGSDKVDFINVCTPVEYKEEHIAGVRNVPLDELDKHIEELKDQDKLYVHCRSGNRSSQAIEKLKTLGVNAELVNVEGGIMAWNDAGYPTNKKKKSIPLMRQVLLSAGILVLLSHVLAYFFSDWYLALSAFVGAGLLIAGATGWCGMAMLLAKMPWNK